MRMMRLVNAIMMLKNSNIVLESLVTIFAVQIVHGALEVPYHDELVNG